jgi:ectoine hydroxylase-related dioxygenase (phytanoyl-CoA dioxygenase family)
VIYWSKPLSDPFGGTEAAKGRHPVKMSEPAPATGVPEQVVQTIGSQLQLSDACLRLYGNPDVLRIAAALHGEDFVPFQEGIIIKRPGEGRSFAWHQDGTTHWDHPDWHQHIHGTNFMPQLYRSTAANGVWFVPGTQAQGKADIREFVARAGSERLHGAVPLVCEAGDMAISNRQILHGSFANTSPDLRVTLNMGFLPYASVIGATGLCTQTGEDVTFDAERIRKRSEIIGYAIDARRQHWPDETPYDYRPHAGQTFHWDARARQSIQGYNLLDLRI